MATPLAIDDFRDDDQTFHPIRWVDRPALLTNGQVLELRNAIEAQSGAIVEIQADLMTNRERLTTAESALDEMDRTVGLNHDRLDAIEMVLDSDQLPVRSSPPLIPPSAPVPDSRMFGNRGQGNEVLSFETYELLHEVGAALGNLYRHAGITTWEQALATFRVGWELAIPDAERPDMVTVLGWLDRHGETAHG